MNTLTKASMLMLLSAPAMAAKYQPITQCWEAPTAREDGTALYKEEIKGYKINYQLSSPASTPMPLGGMYPNTVNCIKYVPTEKTEVCFTGTTTDTDGLESVLSEVVCKTPVKVIARPRPQIWKTIFNR